MKKFEHPFWLVLSKGSAQAFLKKVPREKITANFDSDVLKAVRDLAVFLIHP